jgi:site-specific DNA-methyltransferase (adenine-specific)
MNELDEVASKLTAFPHVVTGNCLLITGDCREVLASLPRCVTSTVCDPPYGIDFMGRDWDSGVPGRHFWEVIRQVCLPGAPMLAFGGTRMFHRLMVAIEDAQWELRDTLMWVYGSGFPKSMDISKAIDEAAGAERKVTGTRKVTDSDLGQQSGWNALDTSSGEYQYTEPATPEAMLWNGWGTALKPSWEPIVLAMNQLDGTFVKNALKHGVGGINIDACRISGGEQPTPCKAPGWDSINAKNAEAGYRPGDYQQGGAMYNPAPGGRWPANLVHDGSEEVMAGFPTTTSGCGNVKRESSADAQGNTGSAYGAESRPEGMPMISYGDTGSAARFFYCAKASKSEREAGLDNLPDNVLAYSNGAQAAVAEGSDEYTGGSKSIGLNNLKVRKNDHPTVKPLELMRWLLTLVTMPKRNMILDPFMGSGSTGVACVQLGLPFIGIDLDPHFVEIAKARIDHAMRQRGIIPDNPSGAPLISRKTGQGMFF